MGDFLFFMITEKELNAPKGKIIIKQLKSQESEINGILIPTAKTYFNKQAEVISVGFMEGGSFININDNNKKYKNILKIGDRVILRFMPTDRFQAVSDNGEISDYATINPSDVLLIGQK